MAHPIYFRVGNADRITLRTFLLKMNTFLGVLQDFDSALSDRPSGSINWEIVELRKNSPPIVGVLPVPRYPNVPDISEAIEEQLFTNFHSLSIGTERSARMPDAALLKMKRLASGVKRIGPSAVFVNANGKPAREEPITASTLQHVKELTDPKYSAYGSIIGRLESLSVHNGHEFRVWDRTTGRPVRCKFSESRMAEVKDMLPATVVVSGLIHSNISGVPIKLDLEDLNRYEAKNALPTIEEMSGLVDDFTGGRTLKEFLDDFWED